MNRVSNSLVIGSKKRKEAVVSVVENSIYLNHLIIAPRDTPLPRLILSVLVDRNPLWRFIDPLYWARKFKSSKV